MQLFHFSNIYIFILNINIFLKKLNFFLLKQFYYFSKSIILFYLNYNFVILNNVIISVKVFYFILFSNNSLLRKGSKDDWLSLLLHIKPGEAASLFACIEHDWFFLIESIHHISMKNLIMLRFLFYSVWFFYLLEIKRCVYLMTGAVLLARNVEWINFIDSIKNGLTKCLV